MTDKVCCINALGNQVKPITPRVKIKKETLRKHAEKILTASENQINQESLLKRFQDSRVATSPFAYALDVTGESTMILIEGDPYRKISAPLLIRDSDWISLQTICEQ